jgi:hypothetical protein
MTPLQLLLLVAALPVGVVFAACYFVADIRNAVADYIPEVILPPVGLLLFFVFGACVGMFAALLVMPGSMLNDRRTQSELQEAFGDFGVHGPRSVRLASLLVLLLCGAAIAIIVDKAYGSRDA